MLQDSLSDINYVKALTSVIPNLPNVYTYSSAICTVQHGNYRFGFVKYIDKQKGIITWSLINYK